jgi:uncharacterized protein involved in tolerance to divalent cations
MAFDHQDDGRSLRSSAPRLIAELHSYELPECICLTIEDGSPNYLAWIANRLSA